MIPVRTPEPFAETLAVVCDDRARGERLLEAVGHAGRPVFDARARLGGWEVVRARTVLFLERDPDPTQLRRRIRLLRGRARVVVIVEPERPDAAQLALREGALVVTAPSDDRALAAEVRRALDPNDPSVTVDAAELGEALGQALSRKLHRPGPSIRLADGERLECLADRLADLVLAEARGVSTGASIADLDWETRNTAVQPKEESGRFRKRAARGAPDRDPRKPPPLPPSKSDTSKDDLLETRPYQPTTAEAAAALIPEPPPAPPTPATAAEEPRSVPARALLTAALLLIGAVAAATTLYFRAVPSPTATPTPTPTPTPAPALAPDPDPVPVPVLDPAPAPAPAPVLEPTPAPDRAERARRAALRARAHERFGRHDRALRAARLAVRLAPRNGAHRALLEELEAEPAVTEPVTAAPESETLEE